MIGQKIGQYEIIAAIGQGGMATVYKAYQPAFDRHVAIKVLGPQLSQDPTFVKRFQREAKVVARIEHRSIVPIYDYGEHDGVYYIVMRLIEGGTLRKKMHYDHMNLPLTARIIEQVGEALDYAHLHDVIHRDLKPSNILLDERDNAYLTDFGIAKMLGSNTQVTASGVVGTPSYMSPEQCQGKPLGPASDIYALGTILFEILTGKVPYEADTPLTVMYMHVREPIPSPLSINPKLPPAVERIIMRVMAKRAEERYPTASAMAADFREIAGAEEPSRSRARPRSPFRPPQLPPRQASRKQAPEILAAPPVSGGNIVPEEQHIADIPRQPAARRKSSKAIQSVLVGIGGMVLMLGMVGIGAFGLSLLKNGGSNADLVPTLPFPLTPTILPTETPTVSIPPTDIPTLTMTSTVINTPTNTLAPTYTSTTAPTVTPSFTPSASPTPTVSPTPTITSTPAPTSVPGVLPPPDSGARLAFASDRSGNYEIYLLDIDGSNLRQITGNPGSDFHPSWSPDGTQLIFVSTRDGDPEIRVVSVGCAMLPEGCEGNSVQLTYNTSKDLDPAWSPGGTEIAYVSNQDGDFEIFVMNADGSNPRQLTFNTAEDFAPGWSPDGTKITYHMQVGNNSDLYTVSVSGGSPAQVTSTPGLDLWPDWSGDSKKLAYTSTNGLAGGARALFTLEIESGVITQLLDGKWHDDDPSWSPGGDRIAFDSDRGGDGRFDLFVLDLLSGNVQQLTFGGGDDVTPDWQP